MRLRFALPLGIALSAATASVARAQTPPLSCYGKQRPRQVAELLFGRDIGGRLGVSEAAWAHFARGKSRRAFPTA